MAKSAETKALLKAICGYTDFAMQDFDRAMDLLSRDFQETADRLMEAATRVVAKGEGLVEGQEGVPPHQQQALYATAPASPSSSKAADGMGGIHTEQGRLHEVAYTAVCIRKEASIDSGKLAVLRQGELVELFDLSPCGDWARVYHEVYSGHCVKGWMLIKHESLGMLLKP